jgi:hypothetical protein
MLLLLLKELRGLIVENSQQEQTLDQTEANWKGKEQSPVVVTSKRCTSFRNEIWEVNILGVVYLIEVWHWNTKEEGDHDAHSDEDLSCSSQGSFKLGGCQLIDY